jgi:hypothetical protein
MPFSEKSLASLGATLNVYPFHAYGWSRTEATKQQPYGDPPPFKVILKGVHKVRDLIVAVEGQVVAPSQEYDNFWMIAFPRIDNREIDFLDKTGPCGLILTSEKSNFDLNAANLNHLSMVKRKGNISFSGHGILKLEVGK